MRSPLEFLVDALDRRILLTFSLFLLTVLSSADYRFCAAAFCSPRLRRRGSAFACFALPRRNCSAPSPALGRQLEHLDDQLLGCFFYGVHVFALLLGRLSVSVRRDWHGLRSRSGISWSGDYALGEPTARTLLHPEPLARASRHIGYRRTYCLRLVARHALQ